MFSFSKTFCVFFLCIVLIMSGCGSQPTQAIQALQLTSCHRESFVGILYVLVKNNGTDAGTSSLSISYTAGKNKHFPVHLHISLPFIPAQGQRLVMVNMPKTVLGIPDATDSSHYEFPTSKVTLQFSNRGVGAMQKSTEFFSDCTNN